MNYDDPMICMESEVETTLSGKPGIKEIREIALWLSHSDGNKEFLWRLSLSDERRISVNSLWVFTHLDGSSTSWLVGKQEEIIRRLLNERDTSKKRIYLQLLRDQNLAPDNKLTVPLLEFCFSKINSECEPYAIRCLSIYVAFEICRPYPELVAELEEYLNLLDTQSLSPGLKSGLRQTRRRILRLRINKSEK